MIKGVPYDAEIAYLESTGTQWIDTGVVFADNFRWAVDFNGLDVQKTIFGGRTSTTRTSLLYRYSASEVVINVSQYSSTTTPFKLGNIASGRHCVECAINQNVGNVWLDGVQVYTNETVAGTYISGVSQALFADNFGSYVLEQASSKLYKCQMWQSGTLVRDYIPVRVGQVGYLYDRVSRRLFGNAGTGAFTLGPDVATPVMSLHRMAQTQISTPIEWTDGYRYISGGSTDAATGKSVTNTYIPIIGNHTYTVLCGAGGTTNRYAALYTSVYGVQESVAESKSNETFTFTPAYQSSVYLRYTCNTDAKANTYVHDDTDDKYIVKNGRVLS